MSTSCSVPCKSFLRPIIPKYTPRKDPSRRELHLTLLLTILVSILETLFAQIEGHLSNITSKRAERIFLPALLKL